MEMTTKPLISAQSPYEFKLHLFSIDKLFNNQMYLRMFVAGVSQLCKLFLLFFTSTAVFFLPIDPYILLARRLVHATITCHITNTHNSPPPPYHYRVSTT